MAIAKKEAPLIILSCLAVGAYSLATLSIPHGFGLLIDHATRGELPVNTSMRLLGWFLVAGVANFARLAIIGIAGETVIARLRSRLYKAIIRQDAAFFDQQGNRTGGLSQRLTMDTNVAGSSLTEALSNGTKNLLQMVGSMGVMLYLSPQLTTIIAMTLPPLVGVAGLYGRMIRRLQLKKQDAIADCGTVAEERLGNIKTVKAFARETAESKYYDTKVNRVLRVARTMAIANGGYVAMLHVGGYLVLYSVVWGGSMLVATNDITSGTLFSFMLYTIYCGIGITGVVNLATEINKGYGASLRMFDIIDKDEQNMLAEKEGRKLLPFRGEVEFKNVQFAYPTRPETPIYRDLSLKISPGKCTAVVGASGSGKSSLAALLLRIYDRDHGEILVDGHKLDELDAKWLRSRIGFVSQEPVLFGGTIAQNIAYGIEGREWDSPIDKWALSAVAEAAKKANAYQFIAALPAGFNTYCGEGGRSLSGGQKQRIAIARALVKHPQMLILDEATSALDSESEAVVQEAIEALVADARGAGEKSVLMFAHRLSMIRQADVIAVMEDGMVTDVGDFEHVSKNPTFRHLVGLTNEDAVQEERAMRKQKQEAAAAAAAAASAAEVDGEGQPPKDEVPAEKPSAETETASA